VSVRRRPLSDELGAAAAVEDAFARAAFTTLRALLKVVAPRDRAESARIELVRARLARVDGDIKTSDAAARAAATRHLEPNARLFARALIAAAAKQAGRQEEAAQIFAAVERAADVMRPMDSGPALYLLALDAWQERDFSRADALLARNLRAAAHVPESLALRGWIEIRRERYAAAGVEFEAALAALDACGQTDERLRARLVHALANVAAETIDLALGARARAAYDRIDWSADLPIERVNTLGALRYVALLAGDFERAWLDARDAAVIAPRGPYAVLAETGVAHASRVLGDERAADAALARAWHGLRAHRWSAADEESRVALTNFAIHAATTMPAEARKAITLYRSSATRSNALNALDRDRRVKAFEATAAGRVNEALGDHAAALRSYGFAFDIWRELGYDLRAALVALDLRRITGSTRYAKVVRAALERAPAAWFGAALRAPQDPLQRLTPAERRVLAELLAGKSAKAIAESLARSPHTVINHTRKVFAAFDVRSRPRLLARCEELGITATSDHLPRSRKLRVPRAVRIAQA